MLVNLKGVRNEKIALKKETLLFGRTFKVIKTGLYQLSRISFQS